MVSHIYKQEYSGFQCGQIGIVLNAEWKQPLRSGHADDIQAAQRSMDFQLGWFADPIFYGDYPASMRQTLGKRLPSFSEEERKTLLNSCDFFGLNSYSSSYVVGLSTVAMPGHLPMAA